MPIYYSQPNNLSPNLQKVRLLNKRIKSQNYHNLDPTLQFQDEIRLGPTEVNPKDPCLLVREQRLEDVLPASLADACKQYVLFVITHIEQQLYSRVLQTIEMERRSMFMDDCVKILQNSYDEKMKNECFEKEFSIISAQNHSIVQRQSQSFSQSDCFDHNNQGRDSFEQSDDRLKKLILQRQQANQTTKYNHDPHQQGFFVNENIIAASHNLVKHQEQDHQQQHHHNTQSLQEVNSESQQSSSQPQQQSQDSDYVNSIEYKNERYQKQVQTKSSMKRTLFTMRKKYRSYTEDERWGAVHLVWNLLLQANTKGIDFAAQYLTIPRKNITRWMKRKQRKQRVRGRKPSNPNMEENLTNWIVSNIEQGNYLTQSEIRNKAKMFSGNNSFKASKGWLEKYFRRNKFISEGLNGLLGQQRRSKFTLQCCKSITPIVKNQHE